MKFGIENRTTKKLCLTEYINIGHFDVYLPISKIKNNKKCRARYAHCTRKKQITVHLKKYTKTNPNGNQIAVEIYECNHESKNSGKHTEIRLHPWSNNTQFWITVFL